MSGFPNQRLSGICLFVIINDAYILTQTYGYVHNIFRQ